MRGQNSIRSVEWHYVEFFLDKCNPNWQDVWKLCVEMFWQLCVNFDYHCADIHESHAWDLRSSGILQNVAFLSVTDVLGQSIGPIFKGQAIQSRMSSWIAWPWKMGLKVVPKRWQITPSLRCVKSQKTEDLIYTAAKPRITPTHACFTVFCKEFLYRISCKTNKQFSRWC